MTSDALALPQALLDARLVATLPDRAMPSLVAAVEVMVQEGLPAVSLPAAQVEQVSKLTGIFGPRAVLGVHDVDSVEQLEAAAGAGAQFVALCGPDAALVTRARELGVAVLAAALTPTEVRVAWTLGVSAVLVVPAEVMGSGYPEALVQLAPGVTLNARGGLGAYSARRWAEAGATAVWLDEALVGDAFSGGSLSSLRERCQTFRSAVDE
ncbi:bifunctional 4-hydroxy-2-oxoglutarate aldolase/2-dehydro-3-deoxy-phosphogluconate aldolase [Luteococcus sp. Sow4_B9]|uniref:bifunctional 4-hydroxy-2-oxoglutarate aldolase/2-dehydro-3-deoxy-phosphogluconate aldolase n=1 Tax=Luteococcus sp. Sow4_B9 TaxID=3438792 RepID=UPI003F97163C